MNDDYIVPVYTILDGILNLLTYQDDAWVVDIKRHQTKDDGSIIFAKKANP